MFICRQTKDLLHHIFTPLNFPDVNINDTKNIKDVLKEEKGKVYRDG